MAKDIQADRAEIKINSRVTHPSGAPNNDLLFTNCIGRLHNDATKITNANNLQELFDYTGKDGGVWIAELSPNSKELINSPQSDAKIVVDFPEYHEIMPRALVSYERIHGIKTPDIKTKTHADRRVAFGEPFALTGAATLVERETQSNGVPWDAKQAGSMSGRTYTNLATSGGELAIYGDEDIYGVRVMMPIPGAYTDLNGKDFDWAGHQKHNLRILGEYKVKDQQGGSSFIVKIPADTPFLMQAIDKNGMGLNIETTSRHAIAGEKQVCSGCHVHTKNTSISTNDAIAIQSEVHPYGDFTSVAPLLTKNGEKPHNEIYSDITNRKSFAVDWKNTIGPLLEEKCGTCHSGNQQPLLQNTREAYEALAHADDRQDCCTASKWMAFNSAKSSMLTWAMYKQRLDGRDPETGTAPTEKLLFKDEGPDNPETWTTVANHPTVSMSEDEKRLVSRWIDIGSPYGNVEIDYMRPVVTVTPIEKNGYIEKVYLGTWDDSGINSIIVNGSAVANKTVNTIDGPITDISVKVTDNAGNYSQHTFTNDFLLRMAGLATPIQDPSFEPDPNSSPDTTPDIGEDDNTASDMNSNPETFPNDSIPNPNNEPNPQPNSNPEPEIDSPSPIPNSTPIPNNTGNNKSPLEKLATTIKPRSWGQLNTGLTSEFLRTRPGGGGNPLTQYANSAAWDPKTKQLLFIGAPHGEPQKFIIYKEEENFWREEKLFPCPLKDCDTHGYDHSTIDFNNSHFYYRSQETKLIRKTFRYDIASEQWDELPEIPLNLPAPSPKTTAMEYFPELGGLVVVAKNVYLFDFSSNEWRILASDLEMGTSASFS